MLDQPPVIENKKAIEQDAMLCIAWRIEKGESGEEYIYCLEENKFYVYKKGVWEQIFDTEMLGNLSRSMKEITGYTLPARKQIIENLKTIKYRHLNQFNWCEMLNLKNGMVNPHNGDLTAHDSIMYSTIRINYNFDKDAKCDLWLKTLDGIFESDINKLELLQEFFGYCLTRDCRMEKALLLLGESRSGKSTILNTLQYMVGDGNCSHVPLKNLDNPQYTGMMVNKLLNIDGEVSKKAENFEAEFKTIVTGHEVTCNEKYVAPFKFRPFCKFVMSANIFPRITDHSSAFYKRLIIIPCDRVFEANEQNRNLRDELLLELPGILLWAIEGLKRLNQRGKFEEKDFMKDAIRELEHENNPVEIFFTENVIVDVSQSGIEIEKGDFYKNYENWCRTNGNAPMSAARFSQAVFRKYSKYVSKNSSNNVTGKRIWKNLRFIENRIPQETGQKVNWND